VLILREGSETNELSETIRRAGKTGREVTRIDKPELNDNDEYNTPSLSLSLSLSSLDR
jgi:hypothetical protein